MRSGTIHPEDRVVWVGDEDVVGVGSSFKAREVTRTHVAIDPIHGTYEERLRDLSWYRRGTEIVSCREAAKRGIEPWASVFGPVIQHACGDDCSAPAQDEEEKRRAGDSNPDGAK